MKKLFIFSLLTLSSFFGFAAGTVAVKSVEAHQRYPWNGLVDVVVTIQGDAADVALTKCAFAATNSATHAVVNVATISSSGNDSTVGNICTRRFIWNIAADIGAVKIDDIALTVDIMPMPLGVQLWANGPYWAECNVGANKPEEYGYYFWWGDTVGYKCEDGTWTSDYCYSGVTWVSSTGTRMTSSPFSPSTCPTYGKSNAALQLSGYIDATGKLVVAHDAATAHLGAPWRMPTDAEFAALIYNCNTAWTMRRGVYGRLVTGRGAYASKSIFLPAAGLGYVSCLLDPGSYGVCWSSTPNSDRLDDAWGLYFDCYFRQYKDYRYHGRSVRPLRGFAQ